MGTRRRARPYDFGFVFDVTFGFGVGVGVVIIGRGVAAGRRGAAGGGEGRHLSPKICVVSGRVATFRQKGRAQQHPISLSFVFLQVLILEPHHYSLPPYVF